MKKALSAFMSIMLSAGMVAYAGTDEKKEHGFNLVFPDGKKELIPFGASYEDAYSALKKIYSPTRLENSIHVAGFRLGSRTVDLSFSFSRDGKFHEFHFATTKRFAAELDPLVYDEGRYITEVFRHKYGGPEECFEPDILSIIARPGHTAFLCRWPHGDLNVHTGFRTLDFRFYAVGSVGSRALAEEILKKKSEQEKTGAEKAAESF
jgi:hypothetical protein